MSGSSSIVSKVWNYAHILVNVGDCYGGYAEQHRIVAEVEIRTTAIDHLEAKLYSQIGRSNRLGPSALVSAFSGRLQVIIT